MSGSTLPRGVLVTDDNIYLMSDVQCLSHVRCTAFNLMPDVQRLSHVEADARTEKVVCQSSHKTVLFTLKSLLT